MNGKPRVDIVGPGAVGSLLAFFLQEQKIAFRLIGHQGVYQKEIRVVPFGGSEEISLKPANASIYQSDIAVFAVKAYQLKDAMEGYSSVCSDNGVKFVTLSNGHFEKEIEGFIRNRIVSFGVVTYGVTRKANVSPKVYQVRSSKGAMSWPSSESTSSSEILIDKRLSHKKVGPSSQATALRVRKWTFNCVLNTLCAGESLRTNGMALNNKPRLKVLLSEAYILAERLFQVPLPSLQKLFAELVELIEATKDNQNSMYADRVAGRPTENPYLAGKAWHFPDAPEVFPELLSLTKQFYKR